ncbi:MAG: ATP-binding protein [Alphaproteobacteria bacterium]|nr:ATP-binding protein [Alphaproteobacteria bacterium]
MDNSIEANSKNIIIRLEWKPRSSTKTINRVKKFIFIDDGDGMDEKGVYDYFVATESTKRNNSSGIGKFGVGAYLSCISQAEIGEVYSKLNGGKWMYTILKKGEKIPKPIERSPPQEYSKFEHGTIIIWDNLYLDLKENIFFDKEKNHNKDDLLIDDLGRIYRKFLTKEKIVPDGISGTKLIKNDNIITISIEFDTESMCVVPYDPLFYTYNRRSADTEKPTIKSLSYKLSNNIQEGYMYVTFSYLPKSWWLNHPHPGNDPINVYERQITSNNQGISIVREGRELYFGSHPGGPIKLENASDSSSQRSYFDVIDRWTGIEIEFSRDADDIFGVEFNKTRIHIEKNARDAITRAISDTVITRRKYFTNERVKEDPQTPPKPPDPIKVKPLPTGTRTKLRKFAEKYKAKQENTDDVYNDLLKGYHISLDYDLHADSPFISFDYEADSVIIRYNMQHTFMNKLYKSLEDINVKGDIKYNANELVGMLIAGYGFSRRQFGELSKEKRIDETLEDIMGVWTKTVRRLSSRAPE